MKKILSLVLVLLMIASMLVACGDTAEESKQESKVTEESKEEASAAVSEEVSVDEGEKLELPDKYWDTTLKMAVVGDKTDNRKYEFWCEETEDDQIIKAFTERTNQIKDKYGITIEIIYAEGLGGTKEEVEKAISTGDQLDLVADGATSLGSSVLNGWYYDLYSANEKVNDGNGYINFDASWWDQTCIESLSIGGKLFFLTGDICVSEDDATWAMFFNKDLITQYGLENPYDLVDAGTWTLDKMSQMAKEVVLMHGEKMSYEPEDGDRWGIVAQSYDGLMFMLGCQQTMIYKNSDDKPEMRVSEEINVNTFGKVHSILTDMSYCGVADYFGAWNSGVYNKEKKIFANGNALFMPTSVEYVFDSNLNESEINYGLIPMPKYDETQEEYSASATVYWLTLVAVPVTAEANLDCTLFALEALAYYGKELITPTYYELVLKGQKLKDERDEEMLDLIFRNRTYDIGTIYEFGGSSSPMIQFYTSLLSNKTENTIISSFDSKKSAYQSSIDTFMETFEAQDY